MSTKDLLKHARSLQQKKFRDERSAFLVEGQKLVEELLRSGWKVQHLFATAETADRMALPSPLIVAEHELQRTGTLESGIGVLAVAEKPVQEGTPSIGPEELVLALDGVNDPGNLGTVIRIADWFGIRQVWCSEGSVDVYNPKTVRSSMGGIFRVAVRYCDLAHELGDQERAGTSIYMATMDGRPVFEETLGRKALLVLGSESHGLSTDVLRVPHRSISVPRGGQAESLNVAMAASALCMEFARQRTP